MLPEHSAADKQYNGKLTVDQRTKFQGRVPEDETSGIASILDPPIRTRTGGDGIIEILSDSDSEADHEPQGVTRRDATRNGERGRSAQHPWPAVPHDNQSSSSSHIQNTDAVPPYDGYVQLYRPAVPPAPSHGNYTSLSSWHPQNTDTRNNHGYVQPFTFAPLPVPPNANRTHVAARTSSSSLVQNTTSEPRSTSTKARKNPIAMMKGSVLLQLLDNVKYIAPGRRAFTPPPTEKELAEYDPEYAWSMPTVVLPSPYPPSSSHGPQCTRCGESGPNLCTACATGKNVHDSATTTASVTEEQRLCINEAAQQLRCMPGALATIACKTCQTPRHEYGECILLPEGVRSEEGVCCVQCWSLGRQCSFSHCRRAEVPQAAVPDEEPAVQVGRVGEEDAGFILA
ncbi:hypothetical protein C8F01DRAFT_1109770 [Mycena amicta]|nr:hypothetical protein C8F01DRAFT_1109770 [Mycena amicta]